MLFSCIALLAFAGASEDLGAQLAALNSPRAEERRLAERWIAAHATAEDYPALAEYLASCALEPRLRVTQALGSDRHFALAVLLSEDQSETVRAVALDAVHAMIARWQGEPDGPPSPLAAIGNFDPPGALELRLTTFDVDLDVAVDRLARLAGHASARRRGGERIEIAIAPTLAGARAGAAGAALEPVTTGTWTELVLVLASASGAAPLVFGAQARHPWVCLARSGEIERTSAGELLLHWCHDVAADPAPEHSEASARALATCGFPPALEWLAARWSARDDQHALTALALAAARERVAPELASARGVRALLARADAAVAERPPATAAGDFARSLAAIGPWGGDGSALVPLFVQDIAALDPARQRLRLWVAARMGARATSLGPWLARVLAKGRRSAAEAAVALDALVACAAVGEPLPPISAPRELFEAAAREGRTDELVAAWQRAELAAPELAEPGRELELGLHGARLEILLGASAPDRATDAAARALAELARSPAREAFDMQVEALTRSLDRGRTAVVAGALAGARGLAANEAVRDRLDRAALAAGCLEPEHHGEVFERLIAAHALADDDWILVGALAAGPAGQRARAILVQMLESRSAGAGGALDLGTDWVRGLERAILELGRADAEETARDLFERAKKAAASRPIPELGLAIADGAWPLPAARRPRDLDREDRMPFL